MIVVALIIPLMAGYAFCSFMFRSQSIARLELAAFSFLQGQFLIALALFGMSVVHVPVKVSLWAICILSVIAGIAALFFGKNRKMFSEIRNPVSGPELAVGSLAIGFMLLAVVQNAILPNLSYDGFAIYAPKAKAFFLEFSFDYIHRNLPHTDYPPLLPLSEAWNALICGQWNERLSMFHIPFFMISGAVLIYTAMRRFYSRLFSGVSAVVFIGTPQIFRSGTSALCDLPLGVYLMAGLILLHRSIEENTHGYELMAVWYLAAAAWMKNEGFPLAVCSLVAYFIFLKKDDAGPVMSRLQLAFSRCVYFTILVVPWWIFKLVHDLQSEYSKTLYYSAADWINHLERIPYISRYFLTEMMYGRSAEFFPGEWLSGWLFFLIAFLIAVFWRSGRSVWFCGTVVLLQLGLFFVVFIVTPYDVDYQLRTALDRTLLQLYPGAMFLTLWILGKVAGRS